MKSTSIYKTEKGDTMEILNTVLGIVASIISIYAAITSTTAKNMINNQQNYNHAGRDINQNNKK